MPPSGLSGPRLGADRRDARTRHTSHQGDGGNFLRVSHYPQDPVVMEMCDRLGIVTGRDPGSQRRHRERGVPRKLGAHGPRNGPSGFQPPFGDDLGLANERRCSARPTPMKPARRVTTKPERVARTLEETLQRPSRWHDDRLPQRPDRYAAANLTRIPMIQGWNLYQDGTKRTSPASSASSTGLHAQYPDKAIVTEYGADVDPRLHSFARAVRFLAGVRAGLQPPLSERDAQTSLHRGFVALEPQCVLLPSRAPTIAPCQQQGRHGPTAN